MMCGKRWPPSRLSIVVKRESKQEKGESRMSTTKECRNCGRVKVIQADGMCGGCRGSVYKKYEKGTPEYDAALADAKARFTDPDHIERKKPAVYVKPKKDIQTPAPKPKEKQKDIIAILQDRRHELMEEVMQINQTISTIEKYMAA
jgi:hypothetical protein